MYSIKGTRCNPRVTGLHKMCLSQGYSSHEGSSVAPITYISVSTLVSAVAGAGGVHLDTASAEEELFQHDTFKDQCGSFGGC